MCLAIIHTVASSFMQAGVAPWKFSTTCNSNFVSSTHKRIKVVAITKGNTSLSRYKTLSPKAGKKCLFLNKEILAKIVLNQSKNVVLYIQMSNNLSVTKIEEQQAGQETLPFTYHQSFPYKPAYLVLFGF